MATTKQEPGQAQSDIVPPAQVDMTAQISVIWHSSSGDVCHTYPRAHEGLALVQFLTWLNEGKPVSMHG